MPRLRSIIGFTVLMAGFAGASMAQEGGGLTLSPTSLTFNATAGGGAPPSQTLSVTASSRTAFTASVSVQSGSAGWLRISPSGTLNTNQNLTVSVNPIGLAAGTYNGTISQRRSEHRQTVGVSITVAQAPATITLNPTSFTFNATVGGAAPASQSLTVNATRTTSFTASASVQSGGTNWLSISPSGALTTNRTLTVSVNLAGLVAGSYSGTITVVSGGVTRMASVTLVVSPAAGTLTLAPTSFAFSATVGGTAPASQSLTVSATTTTSFTAGASVQSGGTNWLSISPSGALTTNRTLTVSVSLAGLVAGSYTGTISVVSGGVTRTASVSLVVSPAAGTLTLAPTSFTFNGTLNTANPASQTLSVTATSATAFTASASVQSGGANWLSISPSGALTTNQTLTVSVSLAGLVAGTYAGTISIVANGTTRSVPVTFVVGTASTGGGTTFKLIGWNELGMHCDDGQDYSVFGVLPPYNSIHAHLIDSAGTLIIAPAGYTVTYQAITDPLTNTINTTTVPKTNFWTYAAALGFGALAPDVGVAGSAMPGTGNTPRAMNWNASDNTWLATAVPMSNLADAAAPPYPINYYPMMRLVAKNTAGTVLATTDIVLPISDEMSCSTCHASNSVAAARPAAGWVNNANLPRDVKLNVLRKHDDNFAANALFRAASAARGYSATGLEAQSAIQPFLCASCHGSNALSLPGYPGVPALTTSVHGFHSTVIDPATSQTLESSTTRAACYHCHPGPVTQCVRGAMSNLASSTGGLVECQSCHGTMSTLAVATRQGWLNEPACQECHSGTATSNSGQIVYTSVFTTGTTVRVAADQTFATNVDTPAAGLSMYRFSKGHGGLQCEACHGSTHAEFPTTIVNDNVQSTTLQGHVGMLIECASCHASVPNTVTGGPHGLHPVGTSWVSTHQDVAGGNQASCQPCHGTDYRGTILSKTQADRTLAGHSFPRGTVIGCYSCHNGPGGG